MKTKLKEVHRSIRFDYILSQHLMLFVCFVFFKVYSFSEC